MSKYNPEVFNLNEIKFIQARHYTKFPKRSAVDLVVIHSMETPDDDRRAENSAARFASESAPQASYHYAVDADSIVQTVEENRIAWHAPGVNKISIGVEHAGYAKQTIAEWDDEFSRSMLILGSRLVARICYSWNIPVVFVDAIGLLAKQRGITTHAEVTKAFKKSKHMDPGVNFPLNVYLDKVNHYLVMQVEEHSDHSL